MYEKLISWGKLLRLPNLFTVPGDPLVGFLIISGGKGLETFALPLIYVICSALCIYLYGLVTNDIADFDVDLQDRPHRPLPSEAISLASAKIAAVLFAAASLGCGYLAGLHSLAFAVILLLFVSFYNFAYKNHIVFGPFLLALCRVSSVMLGASAFGGDAPSMQPLYFVLPALFFYIYGVSEIAKNETVTMARRHGRGPICISILVCLLTVAFFSIMAFNIPEEADISVYSVVFGIVLYLIFTMNALRYVLLFTREQQPAMVQRSIGALIRNLMLFQAAWCAFADSPILAACLIILSYNAKVSSQKFYGS